jgi:hypothetical protein
MMATITLHGWHGAVGDEPSPEEVRRQLDLGWDAMGRDGGRPDELPHGTAVDLVRQVQALALEPRLILRVEEVHGRLAVRESDWRKRVYLVEDADGEPVDLVLAETPPNSPAGGMVHNLTGRGLGSTDLWRSRPMAEAWAAGPAATIGYDRHGRRLKVLR